MVGQAKGLPWRVQANADKRPFPNDIMARQADVAVMVSRVHEVVLQKPSAEATEELLESEDDMPKPVTRTARLSADRKTLTITRNGVETEYRIEDVDPHPNVANPGYSLHKKDGEVYHVSIQRGWPTCTCIGFEMSKKPVKSCRHTEAMKLFGFLQAKVKDELVS